MKIAGGRVTEELSMGINSMTKEKNMPSKSAVATPLLARVGAFCSINVFKIYKILYIFAPLR